MSKRKNKIRLDQVTRISEFTLDAHPAYSVEFRTTLATDEFNRIMEITRDNMKEKYESSSWGWDESKKRKELKSPAMRYIILKETAVTAADIIAFVAFQFTIEPTLPEGYDAESDDPFVDVLVGYLFEMQVVSSYQRKGLGRYLMTQFESAVRQAKVSMLFLTVLKNNPNAHAFYEAQGWSIDRTSPSQCLEPEDAESFDYELMSKLI